MDFVSAFLNLDILREAYPILLRGAWTTILFSIVGIPVAVVTGLTLALMSLSTFPPLRILQAMWVDLFRAVPPLVLVILIYAGLPFLGLELGSFASVTVTFVLNLGAYFCEAFRAGIDSVPVDQREAARSTGLNSMQAFVYVVLPQAARNVLPELVSNIIEGVKLSTVGSVVAMPELLFQARQIQNLTYNATPLVAAAILYFVLLWPLVRLLSRLENKPASMTVLSGKRP